MVLAKWSFLLNILTCGKISFYFPCEVSHSVPMHLVNDVLVDDDIFTCKLPF